MSNNTTNIKQFYTKHPIICNLIAICFCGFILIVLALWLISIWTHHGETSTVPQTRGMSYQTATMMLHDADLDVEIADSIYDRMLAPGTIVESWPRAGAVVKRGRVVYLTINAFSPKMVTIAMPVIGVSTRQAVSYLEALGITSIRLESIPSQYPDLVEDATADNRKLNVGTSIPVTTSVTLKVGALTVDTIASTSLDDAIDLMIDDIDFE